MLYYNKNYNPYKFSPNYLLLIYFFYDFSKPFYNNRLAKIKRLFIKYIFIKNNIKKQTF